MASLSGAQVRESFLRYFEERGHRRVRSSSLVPSNDPTLLFTNAGMVQFKDVFTGREQRDYSRATTAQKCVRAGGKHNDLDNVGFTARHHTFFEMLGNFSFGDYFKKDAIAFAWEYVTLVLGLDQKRLATTVFNGEKGIPWDEEAFELWAAQGVPQDRIYKLGFKDNFWVMGDTGPCGPCSEIHYHQGNDFPCPEEAAGRACLGVACDCDRWLEIWNLVFMQFERKEKDSPLAPLPRPSIDTGAGLERVTAVVQGKKSNYDTDLFVPLLETVEKLSAMRYGKDEASAASMRVIADHSRAAAFLIADGVQPSNEGRGYVLRRIMRRAIRHGAQRLGLREPFMHRTVESVISMMGAAYPELNDNRTFVLEATRHEEESFRRKLHDGLRMIDEQVDKLKGSGTKELSGELVFALHDTHGFPWDLTQIVARERGFDIDVTGFERLMDAQRKRSQFAGSGEAAVLEVYQGLARELKETAFLGYDGDGLSGEGTVRALVRAGTAVTSAEAGEEVEVVLDRTPFYGEAGGQLGDTGRLSGAKGTEFDVADTRRPVSSLIAHRGTVKKGTLRLGDRLQAQVDGARRTRIRANHSATHLLHRALKATLGDHVKQAGSVVAPELLRFDYAHFSAPTPKQLDQVEDLVNRWVQENAEVTTRVMGLEQARQSGAVALFGEKYGEQVRVVCVHPESTELCGGTHVRRTGDIGLVRIVGESSIASGVRRITALTGMPALAHCREAEHELRRAADVLRATPQELTARVEATQRRLRELEKKLEEARLQSTASKTAATESVRVVDGIKVLTQEVAEADAKLLRSLADKYRDQLKSGVVGLGGRTADGKALILVAATKDLVQGGFKAGDVIRELAKEVGGTGGGKPDMAQAGGNDPSRVPAALERLAQLLKRP